MSALKPPASRKSSRLSSAQLRRSRLRTPTDNRAVSQGFRYLLFALIYKLVRSRRIDHSSFGDHETVRRLRYVYSYSPSFRLR